MGKSALAYQTQPIEDSGSDRSVRPFELFFDLVFVFAFTQVTQLLAKELTWGGLGGGLLLLAALWLAWQFVAWLGTTIAVDERGVRLAILVVMGGMLTVAIATPGALAGGALLFAAAYAFVRVMELVLFATSARRVPGITRALLRLVPSATLGPGLILAGAISKVGPLEAWIGGALFLEYGFMYVMKMSGWKVSPKHFAERHGLIFIVALGEAVISIGVGAPGLPLDEQVVLPAVIGLAVIVGLWWTYFDYSAPIGERKLSAVSGVARARLARDAYSYIHLVMVAGVILFSLGVKKTLSHAYDPLALVPAVALCGGLGLYLLGEVAFQARCARSFEFARLLAAVASISLVGIALSTTALLLISAVAIVLTVLIVYESLLRPKSRRSRPKSRKPRST